MSLMRPPRTAWGDIPDVLIHSSESNVKQHPDYRAAKSGDAEAAKNLINDTINNNQVEALRALVVDKEIPILVSAHALEADGINAIPDVFANILSKILGWNHSIGIVQTNVVSHTGSNGYGRLSRPANFDGTIEPGRNYVIIDDFVALGGTLANLKGHIETNGGHVIGAVSLTGKQYSAKLKVSKERLDELRNKHPELEQWWKHHFGHTFDALTESEARYLARSPDVNTIRNRIAEEESIRNETSSGIADSELSNLA